MKPHTHTHTPNQTYETNFSIESFQRACAQLKSLSQQPTHILADIPEGREAEVIKRGTILDAARTLKTVEASGVSVPI